MRGEKVIDLGFSIDVSQGGEYVPLSKVTIRAPGLGKFEVHNTMKSWVEEGLDGFRIKQLAQARAAGIDLEEARKEFMEQEGVEDDAQEDDDPRAILSIMSRGLGHKGYVDFMRYMKGALTGAPKLAIMGERAEGQKVYPITDEVWASMEEAGGTEAVERIFGTFADFFLDSPDSPKPSGSKKSTSSRKRTKG